MTHTHNGTGQGCPYGDPTCSPAYLCLACCEALVDETYGTHEPDPVLDDSPTCWCGEPAEYVNPAEPDLFPTTTHLANGQPAYFTCFPHTHSDLAQPVGHLYSTYHGCLVAADNLGDTGTGWPTT